MKEIKNSCFINGQWITPQENKCKALINPGNGKKTATIHLGDTQEAELAVKAARQAFDDYDQWQGLGYDERQVILNKIADLIEANREELAIIESTNQGMPISFVREDVDVVASIFRYAGENARNVYGQSFGIQNGVKSHTARYPIGVCAVISPWNYPMVIGCSGIAPALAMGNTVVFKPSDATPMSAIKLFEIFEEAGVPKGVVNLICGSGRTVGNYLAEHMDVDKITFVGSTSTGRAVMKGAASNFKSILLELGGKSPFIVFDDADLELAADDCMASIFTNSGQTCTAGSRLIIHESVHDQFMEMLKDRIAKLIIGPGTNDDTDFGPVVNESQMLQILEMIEDGEKSGAKLVTGGRRIQIQENDVINNGFYVEPTIFTDVLSDMAIWKEEIFGPVLVTAKFSTDEEALSLANDSDYALASGIYTKDVSRVIFFTNKIEAGVVYVNGYFNSVPDASCGGWKQSGIGLEGGINGLAEYSKSKQINITI